MSSTSIHAARPQRWRRATVAMSLTAALAGGTLVAGAGTAAAAPAPTVAAGQVAAATSTPDVRFTQSMAGARKGKGSIRPSFTVKLRSGGAPSNGKATISVRGKKPVTKKLGKDGKVRFQPLLGNYRLGKNKVVLRVIPPANSGLSPKREIRSVKLKPKAAPTLHIKQSRKSGTKGKNATRPAFSVKAAKWGDPVKGKVKIYVKGKHTATKKLHHGKATFRPTWKNYRVGKNKVKLRVAPVSGTGLHPVTKARWVKAKSQVTRGEKVVKVANRYVGSRYSYGGGSPRTGFDCSGFTSYVYKKATGKSLPRSSSAQRSVGKKVSRSHAKKGDIVYTPGHVAIYAGNGRIIESARPGVGVVKRKMWQDSPTFIRV